MKLIRNRGRAPDHIDDDDYNGGVRHLAETSKSELFGRSLKEDICAQAKQFSGSYLRR